jgi:hypothetical protein
MSEDEKSEIFEFLKNNMNIRLSYNSFNNNCLTIKILLRDPITNAFECIAEDFVDISE